MVCLAALGLRWGEIAGLRVGRIDFLRHTVTVAEQRTRGEKGAMVNQDPKSKRGFRTFIVPRWMIEMLTEHLAGRAVTGSDPEAFVFVTLDGSPLHYSNWRERSWFPATRAAGFDGLHFDDLRHTAATALVDEGIDIKTAQTRLGHSEQVMLRIYAQATAEGDRRAVEAVGERFRPRDGRAMDAVSLPPRPGIGTTKMVSDQQV
jgi:integrase